MLHGHLVDRAWRRRALAGVVVHEIPGHHGTIMRPPHLQELARRILETLDGAGTRRESSG
jgi:thioesterase domain-containing protein